MQVNRSETSFRGPFLLNGIALLAPLRLHSAAAQMFATILWSLALIILLGLDTRLADIARWDYPIAAQRIANLAAVGGLAAGALVMGVDAARLRSLARWVLPVLVYCACSSLWSLYPGAVLAKTLSSGSLVLAVLMIHCSRTPGVFLHVLLTIGIAVIAASFVLIAVMPQLATGRAALSGLFAGKAHAGHSAAILALLVVLNRPYRRSFAGRVAFVLSAAMVWWSDNLTAALGLSATLCLLVRPGIGVLLILCWAGFGAALPAIFSGDMLSPVVDALGRDTTLSGRVYLWQHITLQTEQAGWLGGGFHNIGATAQWRTFSENTFFEALRIGQAFPPHSHNLWLEMRYMLGVPGTILLFGLLVVLPIVAWRRRRLSPLVIAGLGYLAVVSGAEVFLFTHSLVFVLALFAMLASLDRGAR